MMNRLSRLLVLILIVVFFITTGCSKEMVKTGDNQKSETSAEKAPIETIKIGVILSLTGPLAPVGESIKEGFNLYLAQHNNMLGNKKAEVIFEDDEGTSQVGLRKYRKLVTKDKINILVGPVSTAVAYALRDEVEKDKIILINANAAADELSWKDKSEYIYRTSFSSWQYGTSPAPYLVKNIGKNAVVIGSDYPAGHEMIDNFKWEFEKNGGKIIKELYPKLGTNDFASYLSEIAQAKPDVVYAFSPGNETVRLIKQYSEFGLKGKIPLSGNFDFGEATMNAVGAAAEGIIAGVSYSPELNNPVNIQFVKDIQDKYKKSPDVFHVGGYDSAQVIAKALETAKSIKPEDLIKTLKGISIESPRGTITIDPKTNNPIQNFYIVKVANKGNKFILDIIETNEKVAMPEQDPKKNVTR